jgi:NADPH:quinone reductase
MRAIVIKEYGGPEVLAIEERPDPKAKPGEVVIEVKAFGLNHAEVYFRKGAWGDVAEITGIECVGLVKDNPEGRFLPGQKVAAVVGGMGRSRNGSYAELTSVPTTNVVAINTDLPWEDLAAIPESYITAWTGIEGILSLTKGQTIAIRGATSALGQAAVNIAAHLGAHVIATTRNSAREDLLKRLGAEEVLIESAGLSGTVLERHLGGIDAVLDIVGNTTVLDSLAMLRRNGRVCQVGFLGGGGPQFSEGLSMCSMIRNSTGPLPGSKRSPSCLRVASIADMWGGSLATPSGVATFGESGSHSKWRSKAPAKPVRLITGRPGLRSLENTSSVMPRTSYTVVVPFLVGGVTMHGGLSGCSAWLRSIGSTRVQLLSWLLPNFDPPLSTVIM